MRSVIVIGSGLSGMAAATQLVDAGYSPIILERNNHLGGRTASWNENGMEVESGLHRYLGFYKHLPELLKHVGINMDTLLCWEDEVEIRHPDFKHTVLGLAPLHKPLKTLKGLLGENDFLSPTEKAKLFRFFVDGAALYIKNTDELDKYTLKEYAYKHGIEQTTLEKLLIPLSEGIFSLAIDTYSAYVFFGLFLPYTPRLAKVRVGAFLGGMTDCMIRPIVDYIEEKGGEVRLNSEVEKIIIKNNKAYGVIVGGEEINADAVILAASLAPAQHIIKNSTADPFFKSMLELLSMPVVTLQIELSEPALPVDRTTFGPTTVLAAFSEQSRTTFRESKGRLSVIMSTPERFMHMNKEDILSVVIEDAKKLGINIENKIIDYRKITEPNDFYLLSPGADKLRPNQATPIKGLALAGDYTAQKYLATMEGAVYSGNTAARHIMKYLYSME